MCVHVCVTVGLCVCNCGMRACVCVRACSFLCNDIMRHVSVCNTTHTHSPTPAHHSMRGAARCRAALPAPYAHVHASIHRREHSQTRNGMYKVGHKYSAYTHIGMRASFAGGFPGLSLAGLGRGGARCRAALAAPVQREGALGCEVEGGVQGGLRGCSSCRWGPEVPHACRAAIVLCDHVQCDCGMFSA